MRDRLFKPLLAGARIGDRLTACAGAMVCIALTVVVCSELPLGKADLPVIVAPLGASAVLVFAVPASPLARPWSVLGGNVLSTLVGVAAFQSIPNLAIATGVAVSGAILVMSLLRCLHPPGGAAALTAVIGSHDIHSAGYLFAFAPVGLNSIALLSLATFFHRATGHSFPHRPAIEGEQAIAMQAAVGLLPQDLDAALADMHETFDIGREDLDALLVAAELHARRRRQGDQASIRG
jgi:CBS domain-containing membrane protein